MIITPHNPKFSYWVVRIKHEINKIGHIQISNASAGKVFSEEELEFIAGVCKKHDVLVISDEVTTLS